MSRHFFLGMGLVALPFYDAMNPGLKENSFHADFGAKMHDSKMFPNSLYGN